MSDDTTEPDLGVESDTTPFRCRVSIDPTRWVWLSGGEMHDHRVWGSLLEDPDGPVTATTTDVGTAMAGKDVAAQAPPAEKLTPPSTDSTPADTSKSAK